MKKFYLLVLLLVPLIGQARVMGQTAVVTAGEYYEAPNGALSWAIGEVVVASITDGTTSLSQGIHQGGVNIVTLAKGTELLNKIKVYPNPVVNFLTIESSEPNVHFQLVNVNGQVVEIGKCENEITQIDLTSFPSGTYVLKLNNNETHKVIKY